LRNVAVAAVKLAIAPPLLLKIHRGRATQPFFEKERLRYTQRNQIAYSYTIRTTNAEMADWLCIRLQSTFLKKKAAPKKKVQTRCRHRIKGVQFPLSA